jgi:hypothetical protein
MIMKNKVKFSFLLLALVMMFGAIVYYVSNETNGHTVPAIEAKKEPKLDDLTYDKLQNDDSLLYAAIIFYGYTEIGNKISRWKELATAPGIEIKSSADNNYFVYERGTPGEQNLRPNNFRIEGDEVIFESFIVHSNGTIMKESQKIPNILSYINKKQENIKLVYELKGKL